MGTVAEVDPHRLAFASTALALGPNGLDWRDGDNIVLPGDEFPCNSYLWRQLRHDRRGDPQSPDDA